MSITATALETVGPLVLQCAGPGCRAVLGDSSDYACSMRAPDGTDCLCLRGERCGGVAVIWLWIWLTSRAVD